MASSLTTKTSAMPSNSTLHYAAKQLDDRQLEPKTPQQSLLHSNCIVPTHAGRHERNCSRLPSSRTVPEQTSRTLKMSAHGTSRTRLSPRVRVQLFPSMKATLKTSTRSSTVSMFNRFHPRRTLKTSMRSSSVSVFNRYHPRGQPRRPQQDPPLCPCSTASIHDENLEDLNEILLCVCVQTFPSTTETLKTLTRSSTVTVFNRFHP